MASGALAATSIDESDGTKAMLAFAERCTPLDSVPPARCSLASSCRLEALDAVTSEALAARPSRRGRLSHGRFHDELHVVEVCAHVEVPVREEWQVVDVRASGEVTIRERPRA